MSGPVTSKAYRCGCVRVVDRRGPNGPVYSWYRCQRAFDLEMDRRTEDGVEAAHCCLYDPCGHAELNNGGESHHEEAISYKRDMV